eukprot:CAMPEP_0195584574 /NCGR_PEP_ID=MMETSP0814-20130614/26170_1 /TAXON_ID=97485 /ORGANISM="Prymnesium parvum, Strain Texoma1" /LENGTH=107 /DNA_ID=CAMNT_0040722709 /DNA_START=555 /DNA_END=878 /DNA_ORIENTATION=-
MITGIAKPTAHHGVRTLIESSVNPNVSNPCCLLHMLEPHPRHTPPPQSLELPQRHQPVAQRHELEHLGLVLELPGPFFAFHVRQLGEERAGVDRCLPRQVVAIHLCD